MSSEEAEKQRETVRGSGKGEQSEVQAGGKASRKRAKNSIWLNAGCGAAGVDFRAQFYFESPIVRTLD